MSENDRCEIFCFDEEKVNRVQNGLSNYDFESPVNILKGLADITRLKIAYALTQEDELCVCDVANITSTSMATASHHLRMLRSSGLANRRKEGKLVFYFIHDEQIKAFVQSAINFKKGEVLANG